MIIRFEKLGELRGRKIVYAGGFFDLFHIGHLLLLQEIREKYPDHLFVVGIAPDERALLKKGVSRPIIKQEERAQIVDALKCVDYVFLMPFLKEGEEHTVLEAIRMMAPEILIASKPKPADYAKKIESFGTKIVCIDRHTERSTTSIIERLKGY